MTISTKVYKYDASFSPDYSKLYENLVFLALRSKTNEVYYIKERQEIDFYCILEGEKQLINVSYEISNPETFEREINSLAEGMEYIGVDKSFLITKEREGTMSVGERKVVWNDPQTLPRRSVKNNPELMMKRKVDGLRSKLHVT